MTLVDNHAAHAQKVFSNSLIYGLAIIWLLITIYPILFLVQNSFKQPMEFFTTSFWALPDHLSLKNYQIVWANNFPRFLLNSALLTGVSLTLILFVGSAAAFGLSSIRFSGRNLVYWLFVGGLTIPIHITLIPVYIITRRIGLYDSLGALIGPYVAMNLPVTVFILTSFMATIPWSLHEAGYIDGASRWQIFWMIVLPLSRPAMTAMGIFNSVVLWKEFVFALVLINSRKHQPLTFALWSFQGEYFSDTPKMMAVLVLSMIPLFIGYAIFKERLIEGLTAGAIKG